jgi:hypothetical protein
MKKRIKCIVVVLLCTAFASIPLLVYGQQTSYGYTQDGEKYAKARIKVGDDSLLYGGVDYNWKMESLSNAFHAEFLGTKGESFFIGYSFPPIQV